MDAEALDRRLERLPEVMEGRPYAVNFVALAENPFRETHLAWIKKQRPRFAVIAGGDLSPVRELMECGIEVMYIAPDEALLRLALEAGVRYVVCEGYEAGGHVGQHSTLTLAQMVLYLKRRTPSLFLNCRVILAGGIFNRETAFMAAMLGAEGIAGAKGIARAEDLDGWAGQATQDSVGALLGPLPPLFAFRGEAGREQPTSALGMVPGKRPVVEAKAQVGQVEVVVARGRQPLEEVAEVVRQESRRAALEGGQSLEGGDHVARELLPQQLERILGAAL
jgi:hypothetical protein